MEKKVHEFLCSSSADFRQHKHRKQKKWLDGSSNAGLQGRDDGGTAGPGHGRKATLRVPRCIQKETKLGGKELEIKGRRTPGTTVSGCKYCNQSV